MIKIKPKITCAIENISFFSKMAKESIPIEIRERIIGLSLDRSKSNCEIARLVGVSEKCVRTTLKNNTRNEIVGELPRSGRPKKLTERDVNWLYRQARINPIISYGKLAYIHAYMYVTILLCSLFAPDAKMRRRIEKKILGNISNKG
jgi:hypothetical protein